MNAWLVYWFFGCVIVGVAFGNMQSECATNPALKIADDPVKFAAFIATWPVAIGYVFTAPKTEKKECKP